MKNMLNKILCIAFAAAFFCTACTAQNEEEPVATLQTEESSETLELVVEEEDTSVSIIMVGDVLIHDAINEAALQEDGSYNYDFMFANVKDEIAAADITIANQEVILGGTELGLSGYPTFNSAFEVGDALAFAGFDVILHGTNHALDKGETGILNCLNFWQESYPDIAVLGIHDSQESYDSVYIREENGIKIAILNYTYGTNGISLPASMPYAVNLLDEEKVEADLAYARENADFIIVCPHWGTEYNLDIDYQQEKWAQIFLDGGADLVIGTHPHVIERLEWLRDEESGEEMLVYYSLGNFINSTGSYGDEVAERMVGGMAQVTLDRGDGGEVYISDYGITALVCHLEFETNGITTYKLADCSEALASENMINYQTSVFSYEFCYSLCEEVWGEGTFN